MAYTRPDGVVCYRGNDNVTGVTLNGVDVSSLRPVEIIIQPDGWGCVTFNLNPDTGLEKRWIDGQIRNFTRHGRVQVTLS